MTKYNFIKLLLLLNIAILAACGRTIIEETMPTFSSPSIRAVNNLGNNRVKIDWFFSAYQEPLIKSFKLERSENNGKFSLISKNISANQRSIEIAEPFQNGKVSFRISSMGEKDSTMSAVVSYFAPKIINNSFCSSLSATLLQGTSKPNVYLSWKPTTNYTGNYIVQRATKESSAQTIATITTPYFLDEKTEIGINYIYTIRLATNNCLSNEIPITVVNEVVGLCPQNFKAAQLSDNNSVLLTWDAQLADFASFYVKRATAATGPFENLTSIGIRSSVFEDKTELKVKTSYFYKISTQIDSQPPNNCETIVIEIKK
jgi:hypothetical protein